MKKTLLLFLTGLLLFATTVPASSQMTLQNVSTTTSYEGVDFKFTPLADATVGYVIYIEAKEGTYYTNRVSLPGVSGVWSQACYAFNPSCTAPAGCGPAKFIRGGWALGNSLQCDGQSNRAVIEICKLGSNGVPISVNGYSQVFSFIAPNWGIPIKSVITEPYPGAPPATYDPVPTTTSEPATTTAPVKGKKK